MFKWALVSPIRLEEQLGYFAILSPIDPFWVSVSSSEPKWALLSLNEPQDVPKVPDYAPEAREHF